MNFSNKSEDYLQEAYGFERFRHLHRLRQAARNPKRIWLCEENGTCNVAGFCGRSFLRIRANKKEFRTATRMSSDTFDSLYECLKENLIIFTPRRPISPKCRLFITLVYLAHATSRPILAQAFKIGAETIRKIVLETCQQIYRTLAPIVLPTPSEEDWCAIERSTSVKWGLPNCVGGIDGRHIPITCPTHTGDQYMCSRGKYSILLMASCDTNYNFTLFDLGPPDRMGYNYDKNSAVFGKRQLKNRLNLPGAKCLDGSDTEFPYYFAGGPHLPLRKHFMRPFPGIYLNEERENYNKKLGKARKAIDNAFCILFGKWKILQVKFKIKIQSIEDIIKATIVLHNYLLKNDSMYLMPDYLDTEDNSEMLHGLWRNDIVQPLIPVQQTCSNRSSRTSFDYRRTLCEYLYLRKERRLKSRDEKNSNCLVQ